MNEGLDLDGVAADLARDARPNSGLREGAISHAEVNEAIRRLPKTIIFGQQNRMRDGVLTEDEKLVRFHAGHELVSFFYGGVRQLPEYMVDALLANGISVTLVQSDDLLVFHHAREHQTFHTGRVRKTIYMPEMAVEEAANKGYDYWAISEVVIEEGWPLLDYLLVLELIRRCQQHLHEYYTLGHAFIRGTLQQLNKHRKENEKTHDNEFQIFFEHYKDLFFRFGHEIQERDPYELADEIFDEEQERTWASNKLYDITEAFNYPTYYNIDRDIVHPAAFRVAAARGLPVEPERIEDFLHDLQDAARFGVGTQIKTDALIDKLIEFGEPGIRAFASLGWDEGRYYSGGYYPVVEFKNKLQALSSSPPEGSPGSISHDFSWLLKPDEIEDLLRAYRKFDSLSFRRKKFIVLRLAVLSGMDDVQQLIFEMENAQLYTNDDDVLMEDLARILFEYFLDMDPLDADFETHFICQILKKLDRHRFYHSEMLEQYRKLAGDEAAVFKENLREQVDVLCELIPENAPRQSFDPQRLRARLRQFEELYEHDPDHPGLLPLLAGIFLRLDRSDNYGELVQVAKSMAEAAQPVCEEIVNQIGDRDAQRDTIRNTALRLLREWEEERRPSAVDEVEQEWERENLVTSFYKLLEIKGDVPGRDQALYWYMRDEKRNEADVRRALEQPGVQIPDGNRVIIALLFKGRMAGEEVRAGRRV